MKWRLLLKVRSLPNSFLPRRSPEEWRKKSTSFEGWVRGDSNQCVVSPAACVRMKAVAALYFLPCFIPWGTT